MKISKNNVKFYKYEQYFCLTFIYKCNTASNLRRKRASEFNSKVIRVCSNIAKALKSRALFKKVNVI